jgi:hypothetical protein
MPPGVQISAAVSTNSTAGVPDQTDWGYGTTDPAIQKSLQAQFSSNFQASTPI